VSENGGTWPTRGPQEPRGVPHPQHVLGSQRRTGLPGAPPPVPPGYEPVHHEPRDPDPRLLADPRRTDSSPWRRTERLSRPEAAGWHSAGPAQASHQGDQPWDRYGRHDEPHGQYQDDGYEAGESLLPGFGDDLDDTGSRGAPTRGAQRGRHHEPGRPARPRRRGLRRLAPLVAVLIILIPVAVGGYYAFSFYMSKYHPADYSGPGTGRIVVQVTSGETATSLGPKLAGLGVVASARAFVLAAEHSSHQSGLLPGFYGLRKHMKASLAYALLINPANLVQIPVTIPEGWRLSQIVAWLGAKSGIAASAYDKVLSHPALLQLPAYSGGKPEGYLFPATYEVLPHETALGVLTGMVQRFDQEATAIDLPAAARQVHLTEGQVIIMASLVQAEGGRLSDYPKIARVIYNRLARGIPLQLDSTVLYGLNAYGIRATDQQLNSTSPYNTYKHKGLPPGPIDSPGNAAIQAVLHPAAGNWLYFVTVNPKTGETLFTASQAQFQQFEAELQKNLGQG
jgi:UPF0755 protein